MALNPVKMDLFYPRRILPLLVVVHPQLLVTAAGANALKHTGIQIRLTQIVAKRTIMTIVTINGIKTVLLNKVIYQLHNFLGIISMKFTHNSSSFGTDRIVRQDTQMPWSTSQKVVFVIMLNFLLAASIFGETTSYSVDTIADGLLEAEARLSDIRLDYVFTHRAWNEPNRPKVVVEGMYAQKTSKTMSKRLRYLERRDSIVNPNTGKVTLGEDSIASFNGEVTTILHRRTRSGEPMEPMKGYILASYDSKWFGRYDKDPHTKIWYHGTKMRLGGVLKKFKDQFHIESESEVLDGISTVKLVGTLGAGKISMKLWVSPERNFLPLKRQIMRTGGRFLSETALYDLVQLPNGMWYPKTVRSPADPPGFPNPRIVHIYNISKISIEPIPEEFFTPDFPPNTRVYDEILKASYTTY